MISPLYSDLFIWRDHTMYPLQKEGGVHFIQNQSEHARTVGTSSTTTTPVGDQDEFLVGLDRLQHGALLCALCPSICHQSQMRRLKIDYKFSSSLANFHSLSLSVCLGVLRFLCGWVVLWLQQQQC